MSSTTLTQSIMVVEDDSCMHSSVQRTLRQISRNCKVDFFTTVESAEETLREKNYDLILCDFTLCGMKNGLDLWHTCKIQYPRTPFVMMSGLPVNEFLRLVKEERASPQFLPKPFSLNELSDLVLEYL